MALDLQTVKTQQVKPSHLSRQATHHGSDLVAALEATWQLLRTIETKIPNAVITLVDAYSRRKILGYMAGSAWMIDGNGTHEIAISPRLNSAPARLLATMLHEAAHAVLFESRGNGGVSRGGQYHRKEFRDQCQLFGLECGFLDTRYGWTLTDWPSSGVPARFQPVIQFLESKLPAGTSGLGQGRAKPRDLPAKGQVALHCNCAEGPRTIYVSRSIFQAGGIVCTFCESAFQKLTK